MPNLKHFVSIDRFLKNANVLHAGMTKELTTALYSETTKPEFFFFDETKTIKNAKIVKQAHAFKNYAHTDNVEMLNSFNLELQLKNAEFSIKDKLKNMN